MYEVLIVEDDPMVAMLNKQYIHQNPHFHVAGMCRDGVSGMKFLLEHIVHLVILDVYMPHTDGLAFLRELREKQLRVSVIMVTAANDSATVEEAMRLGVVDYLVKPFDNARFQLALDTFQGRQDALHDLKSLNQQNIDSLMGRPMPHRDIVLPKGIQNQTLDLICGFLSGHAGEEFTGEEIASETGLSRVTVRRYTNYLLKKNIIMERMNYETGGRPGILFRWNK